MKSETTHFFLVFIALTIVLLQPLISCLPPTYPQRISLKQADEIIGRPLPVPTYLPEGYEIQAAYVIEASRQVTTLDLIISDQPSDVMQKPALKVPPDKINLQISWSIYPSLGIKLEGERFDVSEGRSGFERAVFIEREGNNQLLWDWTPDWSPGHPEHFAFWLYADKSIPKEELVKIARSIR